MRIFLHKQNISNIILKSIMDSLKRSKKYKLKGLIIHLKNGNIQTSPHCSGA